jgi:hypothetical protein
MKDPVALAYSGRLDEARAAAIAQASSDESFLVAQGLEALAVLGQQHGVRADATLDAILLQHARGPASLARKAYEAAMALGSRVLESLAAQRLASGDIIWEVLRYAGEWPSHELGAALATGWDRLPSRLRDEALLTTCVMPVANPDEARAWGERALKAARDPAEEVRLAGFVALRAWIPEETADACARALTDESPGVRQLAAQILGSIDFKRLAREVEELGDASPEAIGEWQRRKASLKFKLDA